MAAPEEAHVGAPEDGGHPDILGLPLQGSVRV